MSIRAFENNVSNTRGNRKLSVAGVLATLSGSTYTAVEAYPGQMAVKSALYPSTAFSDVNNPNTWYMVAADADTTIDELYVCNPDVASHGTYGDYTYNLGYETLGVSQPAGEAARYQKVELGDMLTFGDAWFSTAPTSSTQYCVLDSNGLWAPAASAPASGMYFEYLDTVSFTEGCYVGGTGYYGIIKTV